jgi:hypothetical protein
MATRLHFRRNAMAKEYEQRDVSGEKTSQLTRAEIKVVGAKLRQAVRAANYEGFKEALVSDLGIRVGSERFRALEAEFWRAVAEHRRIEMQKP